MPKIKIINQAELELIRAQENPREKFDINKYTWGCEYRPETYAELYFVKNSGFFVRMTCFETNPLAVNTKLNSFVHEDSCMEFFVDFAPNSPTPCYVNFEVNALGTTHIEFGEGRHYRIQIPQELSPKVSITRNDKFWRAEYLIDTSSISSIYKKEISFQEGDFIRANFYKCGDKTSAPHYGVFSEIDTPSPDFHCPQFFAKLYLNV